jgi:beta-lactamase class A
VRGIPAPAKIIPVNPPTATLPATPTPEPATPLVLPSPVNNLSAETAQPSAQVPASRSTTSFPTDQLEVLLGQTGGTFGVVVFDLNAEREAYAHNTREVFSAASLIKVPIVMAVYQLAAQNELNLDERITMQAADQVGGSGILQNQPAGSVYTIRELCGYMLTVSDNTAGNLILQRIGFEPVNRYMEAIGANQTRVQRLFLDDAARLAGRDNLTSPADMSLLLRLLNNRAFAGAQEILTSMANSTDRSKLVARLPDDLTVAHKTGTLTGVEHDVGIVQLANRPYVVVFLSKGVASRDAGVQTIARSSELIYTHFAR